MDEEIVDYLIDTLRNYIYLMCIQTTTGAKSLRDSIEYDIKGREADLKEILKKIDTSK